MSKMAWFIGGICAIGGALAQFPASWLSPIILPDEIRKQVKVSGTIWQGRATGIEGLGPIDFQTFPSHLFTGEALVGFYSQLSGFQAKGGARPGHLSNIVVKGRVSTFAVMDPRLAGLGGAFDVHIDDVSYEGEACTDASGRATTDILVSNAAQWSWQGPVLSGPVDCENGEIRVRLSGAQDGQEIELTLRSNLSGLYSTSARVQTRDPNAQFALSLFGFSQNGQTYQLEQTGAWN